MEEIDAKWNNLRKLRRTSYQGKEDTNDPDHTGMNMSKSQPGRDELKTTNEKPKVNSLRYARNKSN